MILYNNLEFFNKYGKNLNLTKESYVNVTIDRNDDGVGEAHGYHNAVVEAITNEAGQIEFFDIIDPGEEYDDRTTVTITSEDNSVSYTIDIPEFITKIDDPLTGKKGMLLSIEMPQEISGFPFPSFMYKGNMYLEKVSTGLIATDRVYVVEKMVDTSEKECIGAPRTYVSKDEVTSSYISAEMIGDEYEEQDDAIHLFNVNTEDDTSPVVEIVPYKASKDIDLEDGINDSLETGSNMRKVSRGSNTAIAFDIMLKSDNEGVFTQTLSIFEEYLHGEYVYKYSYAEIHLYGETEGEDERLRLALENFAINIDKEELKIFRDSDVNEEMPDYRLLNQKRKEMLLEYHNIYPYLGSYKALVNMINFFGFGDLRVKEYWLNTKASVAHTVTERKLSKNGKPIDLGSLHEYAARHRDEILLDGQKKFVTDEPEFKMPKLEGEEVDQLSEDDIPLTRLDSLDSEKAARAIRREMYETTIHDVPTDDMQYKQMQIPMQLDNKSYLKEFNSYLPSDTFVKTSKFGLFYDIIQETGEIGEDGLPLTEEAFMFSEDEILIKLFGLREYLKERFMPVNSRIVDIVGEAVFYNKFALNTWKDIATAYTIDKIREVDFSIDSKLLIEDLHDYKESIGDIGDFSIGDYRDWHTHNFTNDIMGFKNEEGPIGCPITVRLDDTSLTWDEADISWDEKHLTWEALSYREYSEIQWRIKYKTPSDRSVTYFVEDRGPIYMSTKTMKFLGYEDIAKELVNASFRQFVKGENLIIPEDIYKHDFVVRETYESYEPYDMDNFDPDKFIEDVTNAGVFHIGYYGIEINDGEQEMQESHAVFSAVLPYSGKYKVQCTLIDYTNNMLSKSKEIDVNMALPNFVVFGRSFEDTTDIWDDADFSWDQASRQWRNAGKANDLTWDDLENTTWDTFDFRSYTDQSDPFLADMTGKILSISEADRPIGETLSIKDNAIIVNGCQDKPMLQKGDTVYLRLGDIVETTKVVSATYDREACKTTIEVEDSHGANKDWEILREIKGTVVLSGDVTKSMTYGVHKGKYLLFRSKEFDPYKNSEIRVTSPLGVSDDMSGIVLDSPVRVVRNEYGRLYEKKSIELNDENFDPVNKTITITDTVENDEFIDGFSIVNVETKLGDGSTYKQRLQLKKAVREIGKVILNLVEIDGDMGMITEGESTAWWEYHTMTVKVSSKAEEGDSNKVELNLNDYPFNLAFEEDAEQWEEGSANWLFDYIVKDGSFSIEVNSVEIDSDGNTVVHLNDTYRELYQASPDFKVSWSSFDEEYAETRYGTDIYSWDNFDEVSWDDMGHLDWNMLEYFVAPRCGFEINAISAGGTIQFNSSSRREQIDGMNPDRSNMHDKDEVDGRFSFKNVRSGDDWYIACEELNSTSNSGLSRFDYSVVETESGKKIVAVAKGEGPYYLGYLLFGNGTCGDITDENGISHTYPIGQYENWNNLHTYGENNKEATWNPVSRAYYEYGVKEAARDEKGNITHLLRGWYPAGEVKEEEPKLIVQRRIIDGKIEANKFYENLEKEWSSKDWIEGSYMSKRSECLDGKDVSGAEYEQYREANPNKQSKLKDSVRWRVDDNMRLLYDNALESPFSWDELIASEKEITVKKMTTLFFNPITSLMPGKTDYVWTLYRFDGSEDECVVRGKDRLIWTFTREGSYDVLLEAVDMNGNRAEVTKYGVVRVE